MSRCVQLRRRAALRRRAGTFETLEYRQLLTSWFVSPDGNATNAGTVDSPWDLGSALSNNQQIVAGDTVYLRGGTYRHPNRAPGSTGYAISLQGSVELPIWIRAYQGERATIDGGLCSGSSPAHLRISDLEVIVSENLLDDRFSSISGSSAPTDLIRPWGGINFTSGDDIKLINNVVHANMQGIGFWQNVSGDSELYGNLIYDNGWDGPDRNHGHGVYTQNGGTHDDWKFIVNNILLDNWSNTIQVYGSSAAYYDRYEISQNIYAVGNKSDDGRLLVGGSRPSEDLFVTDNVSYHAELQVGYNFYSGVRANDVVATGNRIWWNIEFGEMTNFTHSDNFAWYDKYQPTPNMDGVIIDVPITPYTFLYENAYDPNRAHLAIQNFPHLQTVSVDMSEFLQVGDAYQLKDPTDFFGAPILVGTYTGAAVDVVMSGEDFAAFVVARQPAAAPIVTLPGNQSASEDLAQSITGVWIEDQHLADGLQVTLTVTHGAVSLAHTTGLSFAIGDGSQDKVIHFSGTASDVNAALATITYRGDQDYSGRDTLRIAAQDQAGGDTGEFDVFVNAINDAPQVSAPGLQNVNEDTLLSISGISLADVDIGLGIIKATISAANGRLTLAQTTGLTFSQGDGTNDANMAFSGTLVNVNAAVARLEYVGTADYVGTDALFVIVDDQGNFGSGGAKSASATVAITVAAVNDAPVVVTPGNQSVNEEALLSIAGISLIDVDAGNGTLQASVSVANGRLSLARTTGLTFVTGDGMSDAAMSFRGTLVDINAALARVDYVGNLDYVGVDTLTIVADDQANSGAGGAKLHTSTVGISVVGVNDAPVLTVPGDQFVSDNTLLAITGICVSDVDLGTGQIKITLSTSNGRLTLAQTTGLNFPLGDGTSDSTMTFHGTLANVLAALAHVDYLPNTGFTGNEVLSVTANDRGNTGLGGEMADTESITIYVGSGNAPPTLTLPGAQSAVEDTVKTISGISVADPDAGTGEVKIVIGVAQGRLSLARTSGLSFTQGDGISDSAMAFTGTLANVNAALATVQYLGNTNFSGNDALSISVDDQGNSGAGGPKTASGSVSIAVSAVNDAPTLTVPSMQSATEDTVKAITGLTVADLDCALGTVKVTTSVTSGRFTLAQTTGLTFTTGDGTSDASMVFTGTLANVNSALATVNYLGNANFNGSDTLTITVDDRGNTGSGGAKTDSKTVAITVSAVNDAPVLAVPEAQATTEDTVKAITGISVVDVDAAAGTVKITVSVATGKLTLAQTTGLTFTTGDGTSDASMVFTGTLANVNSALATVNYVGNANFNGSDTLTITADDQGNTGSGGAQNVSKTFAITVSAVNDAPVLTVPGAQAATEDTVKAITGISVADVDAATGTAKITISVASGKLTLAQTTGLTFTTGDGASDASMVFTGTLANANSALTTVNYVGNANFNGSDTLTITADDQGNTGSGGAKTDSKTVAITVSAVNDAPILTVPSAKTVNEDSLLSITGISVADVDGVAGAVRVTLSATSGRLTLAQTTGLTFSIGDGATDASMTFTGSVANVNSALARVDYLGNANVAGTDSLNITVDDQGNTGSGGAKTDSKSVVITVSAVNDAPLWSVPGEQKTPTGTLKNISGISLADLDAASGLIEVTLSATRGSLTLSSFTGLTLVQGDGKLDSLITFRGSLADVNAALEPLGYMPNASYSGPDTITLTVSDLGNTGLGGAKTDTRTIAVQVGNVSLFSGLAAWWNLNEGGGMRVADTSVSQFDDSGSLRGNAQWNTFGADGAVTLDGDGDGVDVPGSTEVNNCLVTTRTVSGWFYVNDKSLTSRNQVIFEEGGDQRGLNIYVSNGRLYVGGWNIPTTESGWAGTFLSSDQIQSGKWHHVALVLSGGATVTSGAFRGYLDGVEFGSGVGSQLWAHSDPTGVGHGAAYVRFHNGLQSGGNGFAGMVDDLRVYNRALSASEVAEIATQPMAAPCQLTVTVTPTGVWENGSPVTGAVARTGALDNALVVSLTSSQAGRLAVPTTVTIGAGQASANFQLTQQDNSLADGDVTVVVTAAATGCGGGSDTLQVWDNEPSVAGLAGYWALNEGTGTTANDSAPTGVNEVGTLRGNASWSTQGLGRSVQFAGSGVVSLADSSELNLTTVTQRTVSLWFQVAAGQIGGSRQVLFEEGGLARGVNAYLDGGRLYVGGWNPATTESGWAGTFLSSQPLQGGVWHHVALVLSGGSTVQANGLKGYLDGVQFGSGAASQLWSHGDDTGIGRSAEYTVFHSGSGSLDAHGVTGLIDEVRVYKRALSDQEIQVLAGQSMESSPGLTVSFASPSVSERNGTVQGTVTRTGSTTDALVVALASSDLTEATVPSTVTIAAGQTAATFTVSGVDDLVRDGAMSVSISATATGLVAGSGQLQVLDDEKLLVNGVVSNVSNNWVTVNLPQNYSSMVVVATPSYTQVGIPVVTRVRNATGNSFELRVDRADGLTGAVPGVTVHYVVAEEGVYTQARDGVKMEVVKYVSTVTDSSGSFVGESRAYAQAYAAPVLLGQVQTYNDADFSVFWSRGAAAADPASGSVLRVGKHVGEDAYRSRAAETVGYFVIEAGLSSVDGVTFTAAVGSRTVQGMGNAPAYSYTLGGLTAASVAVASMAGQLGADGGWAVLYGSGAVSASRLQLAVDEDQKRDTERAHTTESIGYLVFQDTALSLSRATERRGELVELRLDQVHQLVQRAIALWDTADEDSLLSDDFANLELSIADLPGDELGRATLDGLTFDVDAASQGWFVDPTPLEDEEFVRGLVGVYLALEDSDAADHVDLLSVLAHELGHLRGIAHDQADGRSVMASSIGTGVRRVPIAPQAEIAGAQEVRQRVGVESFLASRQKRYV